jgi:hypothetical protein
MTPQNSWTDDDWNVFEDWVSGLLKTNTVRVTFTKRDGSTRVMLCTRRSDIVPPAVITETKRTKTATPGVLPVFDIELKQWRSFTLRNVSSVEFSLGEDLEQGT